MAWESTFKPSLMLDRSAVDRVVDVASVVLISLTAVLTAICGYQSGRWSGEQSRFYNSANASRAQAAEQTNRALAFAAVDVNVFLHYLDAMDVGDTKRTAFLYRRFPPDFRSLMDAWLATKPLSNANAPSSPFEMPQFLNGFRDAGRATEAIANRDFEAALKANRYADAFLLLTVIFAAVAFLGGMSTKLVYPSHAIVVGIGTVALIYGVVRLAWLPFI